MEDITKKIIDIYASALKEIAEMNEYYSGPIADKALDEVFKLMVEEE